jgi:hypothetical protein
MMPFKIWALLIPVRATLTIESPKLFLSADTGWNVITSLFTVEGSVGLSMLPLREDKERKFE